jgi:hypothetical protein
MSKSNTGPAPNPLLPAETRRDWLQSLVQFRTSGKSLPVRRHLGGNFRHALGVQRAGLPGEGDDKSKADSLIVSVPAVV